MISLILFQPFLGLLGDLLLAGCLLRSLSLRKLERLGAKSKRQADSVVSEVNTLPRGDRFLGGGGRRFFGIELCLICSIELRERSGKFKCQLVTSELFEIRCEQAFFLRDVGQVLFRLLCFAEIFLEPLNFAQHFGSDLDFPKGIFVVRGDLLDLLFQIEACLWIENVDLCQRGLLDFQFIIARLRLLERHLSKLGINFCSRQALEQLSAFLGIGFQKLRKVPLSEKRTPKKAVVI